jgi:hypothetical protein
MSVTASPGQKPDVEAIGELTEYLRALRTVGWSKHLDRPSDKGLHLAKNVNRNFAVLQLCLDDGRSIGLGWLGVSGEPGYSPPAILNKPVILASEPGGFLLNVKELLGLDADAFLKPRFAPLCGTTMRCSEIPLLNGLGFRLQFQGFPKDATGSLYLLTERLPCPSCGHVMRQFRQGYPNFQIHLLYMFDHTAHASERLAADLSNLADSVHLIEVIDDDDKGFTGLTGAAYGSAANPARSLTRGSPVVPVQSKSSGITINLVRVTARKPGDLVAEPTSKAAEVISRGAGSPSAHFNSNILPG